MSQIIEEEYQPSSAETNSTSEELSFESHEAMTKGGEFKPKFTTATASTTTSRQKRSYEFLMGLVNNNSKFQVTNTEDDIRIPRRDKVKQRTNNIAVISDKRVSGIAAFFFADLHLSRSM